MTACLARARTALRAEQLANWLALLALVALGVVWPGADAPRSGAVAAGAAPELPWHPAPARVAAAERHGERDE